MPSSAERSTGNSRGGQGGSPFVSIKEASQKLSYLGYAIRSIWFAFPSTKRCWYEATHFWREGSMLITSGTACHAVVLGNKQIRVFTPQFFWREGVSFLEGRLDAYNLWHCMQKFCPARCQNIKSPNMQPIGAI